MFNLVNAPYQGNLGYPKFTISLVYYSARSPQIKKFIIMPLLEAVLPSVIGGAFSTATALYGTRMRNEAQKRESELAYQRERAAIKEQNSYNSASAQMARLQAAGLNPNLMYESGQQAAAGTQEDIARYQPADLQNAVAPLGSIGSEMIQSLIGLKDTENKTDLTKSQIALNSLVGLREIASTKKSNSEVDLLRQAWGFNEEQNPLLLLKLNGEIGKIEADTKLINKNLGLVDAQISELASRCSLQEAEAKQILTLLSAHHAKLLAEVKVLASQDQLNAANTQLALQNSEYLRSLTWEVTQRYYLDKWNIEQNLQLAEKNYILNADTLGEQVREFNASNTRAWVEYGTDTFFKVADLIIELLPLLAKTAKIGF